eukprot:gene9356-biopygen1876
MQAERKRCLDEHMRMDAQVLAPLPMICSGGVPAVGGAPATTLWQQSCGLRVLPLPAWEPVGVDVQLVAVPMPHYASLQ